MNRNCYPKLHRMSFGQVEEEPETQHIEGGDGSHPEIAAVATGLSFS
jgi:hypothetical protein